MAELRATTQRLTINKTLSVKYIVAWLLSMLIAVILVDVLSFIHLVGIATAFFVSEMIKYSLFGDVYNEVK
mgnify:CR=1 FL=1